MVDLAAAGPGAGRPSLTVVVASRDRAASLGGALAAIACAVGPGDEVIVVDSASCDHLTKQVTIEHGATYVRCDEPGAALARNLGSRHATSDVIAFTDDDCRPHPGWADAFAAAFVDPTVGFAVGPVAGGSAADVPDRGGRRWSWPSDPARIGSGASMAVRRDALIGVGGFDERLGPGAGLAAGEDHELFLRLLRAGWLGVSVSGAVVDHDDRRGRWATLRLFYGYGVGAGAVAGMARSLDRRVASRMVRTRLWTDGARAVARDLGRRWEEPAARGAAMTLGVVVGLVRGQAMRSQYPPRRSPDDVRPAPPPTPPPRTP